jgi:hypothetical protein
MEEEASIVQLSGYTLTRLRIEVATGIGVTRTIPSA